MHAIYSEIRLGQCARVDYFYNNNVQEEPSLSEQEIKKKRIQIIFKPLELKQPIQTKSKKKVVGVMNLLNLCSIVYNICKACRTHDNV